MALTSPSFVRITMKPPPPRLPASGWTTASANPTATAASVALPPRRRMSRPTSLAIGLPDTTMALPPVVTRDRPACRQEGLMPSAPAASAPGVPPLAPRPAQPDSTTATARMQHDGKCFTRTSAV